MDCLAEVSYAYWDSKLIIDKDNIDDEQIRQADSYAKVAEQAGLAHSRSVEAKDKVKRAEAKLFTMFKSKEGCGSNPEVEAKVAVHSKRIAAFDAYLRALELEKAWEGLRDAWQQRSYSLKDITNLTVSGFMADSSSKASGFARSEVDYELRKQRMASARKDKQKTTRREK